MAFAESTLRLETRRAALPAWLNPLALFARWRAYATRNDALPHAERLAAAQSALRFTLVRALD